MDDEDLYDEDFDDRDPMDDLLEECGLDDDGQCSLAGTEHCDFVCPLRDSEDFCGSKAWHEKHGNKPVNPTDQQDDVGSHG